jgi:predicted metal-binding membrane protein
MASQSAGGIGALLRRDRAIVLLAVALVTGLSWAYLFSAAYDMQQAAANAPGMGMNMPEMSMARAMAPGFVAWTPAHFFLMFAMWTVMMIGMMTPSVAPMILIYEQVSRQAATLGRRFAPAGWFAGGYLLAWSGFALIATFAQWQLERLALLTPMLQSASQIFGGAVLIAAGVYQWTPLKRSCLAQCRAPLAFVQRHGGFKPGISGSLRLGALHGLTCIGCCAALMALLFVGGVMNLAWIAAIALFVLVEKAVPGGEIISRSAGLAAIVAGVWLIAA